MQHRRNLLFGTAILIFCSGGPLWSQGFPATTPTSIQEQTVRDASGVLSEVMASPLNRIPAAMLADCHGVAIVPNVIKGGFIVGARHGKGVLFVRDEEGVWHAPVFITLTGGNIGWQVGVQSSDIILVFKTPRSVSGILSGKVTLGGDASAAAGPVGRQAAVATDPQLQAEIYTYSRSRGLFAGVAIDGSILRIDQLSTGAYYQSPGPGQAVAVPPSALQLTQQVAAYAAGGSVPTDTLPTQQSPAQGNFIEPRFSPEPDLPTQYAGREADVVRDQLIQLAPELFELLDPQWRDYLALPQIPPGGGHPPASLVQSSLARYDEIASDPRFSTLAQRPEFRSVHGLLKHYQHALAPQPSALQLPPPPTR